MKSISILGCGWLGMPLGAELLKLGYSVSGSTTQSKKSDIISALGIIPYVINFSPELSGTNYEKFFQSDILIISIPPGRKSGKADNYILILKNIVQAITQGNVSDVIFISSTSVYPDCNTVVTEEDADKNSYLVKVENLLREQSKFKTTVIRFGGLMGSDRHPGRFLSGKQDVAGGDAPVNVIHQDDCIEILKSIIQKNIQHETYNACAPFHPSRKEFYAKASQLLKLEPPHFSGGNYSNYKTVSSKKLEQQLQYKFIHPDPLVMLDSL